MHDAALIFDLDGTLVDTVYQHVMAWHEALPQVIRAARRSPGLTKRIHSGFS